MTHAAPDSVVGKFYAAGSARTTPALLTREGGVYVATVADGLALELGAVRMISERVAGSARRVEFDDGSAFVTEDSEGLDRLIGGVRGAWNRSVAWLERPRLRNFALLAVLLIAVVAALRALLPVAADAAVAWVPAEVERRVGAGAFAQIDTQLFQPSRLAPGRQAELRRRYMLMAEAAGVRPVPPLYFRASPKLGANAIALPGGPVVLTDELVRLAPSDDGVMGVLAHELGHVRERHGLRRIVRAASVIFVASVAIGDVGSVVDQLVALAGIGLANAYSREFEREADAVAVAALRRVGAAPRAFADTLAALHKSCGAKCDGGWLATHPGLQERIEAIGAR